MQIADTSPAAIGNSPEAIERAGRALIGKRIQVPVHYDIWMRGARYGVVTGFHKGKPGQSAYITVKVDHPQVLKLAKIWRMDWNYISII